MLRGNPRTGELNGNSCRSQGILLGGLLRCSVWPCRLRTIYEVGSCSLARPKESDTELQPSKLALALDGFGIIRESRGFFT